VWSRIVDNTTERVAEPDVTMIMTVYNGELYLAEAIESVLTQTCTNFEFTIVDDGSEDGTPGILEEAEKDPRVRVLRPGRVGRVRALNVAWRNGSAPYVANLDADDRAAPQRLEKQLEYMRSHPEIGLLGTAARLEREAGESGVRTPAQNDAAIRRFLLQRNSFVHSSVMIPRRVLEEVDGYDETYGTGAEDYNLSVRIAACGPVANLKELLTLKRFTPNQYFRTRAHGLERYRIQTRIRWLAWRKLSGRPRDLRYVVESVLAMIGEGFAALLSRDKRETTLRNSR
jgi:glycosyltransferase involved in cell wall biosynthesis